MVLVGLQNFGYTYTETKARTRTSLLRTARPFTGGAVKGRFVSWDMCCSPEKR